MKFAQLCCTGSVLAGLIMSFSVVAPVHAQNWDFGARAGDSISSQTERVLKLSFEQRGRYETRSGQAFGRDPDLSTGLYRTRLGLTVTPASWIKFSAMVQDARAPWYGPGAPNTVRDQADLQESYFELFPDSKRGFGMAAGRRMVNYGEARLIGSPQWSNLSRTFDHARVYYRLPKGQLEFLVVSPVKIRIGEFNRPALGDRIWGMYNTFPDVFPVGLVDVYVLRHDQNRPGGFTGGRTADGTDRVRVTTFGGRMAGPVAMGVKFSLEGAVQTGEVGSAKHRAGAWFSGLSRRWKVHGKSLDVSGEYKYASGTSDPANPNRVSTFDQLYPANHDKFGHQDLFGWRNIHNLRSVESLSVTKSVSLNFMYNNSWLASARDGLYSGQGKSIARSAAGTAGRHIGQETDVFCTWKYKHLQFGAGYGYLFKGEFIRKTTPGVNPSYAYVFHTYSF